jgi:hypothetical protein
MVQIIRHRVNSVAELVQVPSSQGVEIDLRDQGNRLVLAHDPFSTGEYFEEFLRHYKHGTLILNIKSERIEWRVLEEIKKASTVKDYFFLDSSFPMIRALTQQGERCIAMRYSEHEPVEAIINMSSFIRWVWIDCFTKMPLNEKDFRLLKLAGLKLCAVSPELQHRGRETIERYKRELAPFPVDAVCTKYPDAWTS